VALTSNSYRILVLEGGRHSLPEHFQNLPLNGQPGSEVWGLAWRTNVAGGFPGLAYTVGGRSLFFGGWSPRQLDEEITQWPASVVTALKQEYFDEASKQIGTDASNDFMHGKGGPAEILDHGRTGVLFAPRDAAAVAEAILRLASVPAPVVFKNAFPDASLGPVTGRIHTYHLGLWFNSPTDGAKAGAPGTTPFNGEGDAGVQVLNTGEFPDLAGPLIKITTSGN
jgi:hypothetical protein